MLYNDTIALIYNALPGETIYLKIRPTHVVVDYLPQHNIIIPVNERAPSSDQVPNKSNMVSIAISTKTKTTSVHSIVVKEKIFPVYRVSDAAVELMFCITYEKSQGKTLKYVILCLHKNPWVSVTIAKMFLGLTRVEHSDYLRIWLAQDNQLDLQRYLTFQHDIAIVLLDKAYDENGVFQNNLYLK